MSRFSLRRSVQPACVVVLAAGCASGAGTNDLRVVAGVPGVEAEIEFVLDGEVVRERIEGEWVFEDTVSGEFSSRLEVTDLSGGESARCLITVEGAKPVGASGGATAICSMSGRAGGLSSNVSGHSETIGATPTTSPDLPAEVVITHD